MTSPSPTGSVLLRRCGIAWYLTAAAGQLAFVWMIAAHYGRKTLSGNYAGWNDKPIITGYVAGDVAGNIMFAIHVLLAAVITIGGLLQLVPILRQKFPALHRWNGRLFILLACVMALGGLWLTWVRHTYLSLPSAIAVSLNGLLILVFAAQAWRLAVARRIETHRHWAMRTFMVVNGVWFLRVFIMAWAVCTHGWGMTDDMSGPVDMALEFGAYLIPLAGLEAWFLAQRTSLPFVRQAVSGLVICLTALMGVGIFGAIVIMWGPYMGF